MRATPRPGLIAIALLATGCQISTHYTPRTPGIAALGMEKGEVGIYKGGILTGMSTAMPVILQCSPTATATASKAAEHHESYRSNTMIGAGFYAVGAFVAPMFAVGAIFIARGADEQQESRAILVDAINVHNDEAACVAAATAVTGAPGSQP
jgi:hypothetical protein